MGVKFGTLKWAWSSGTGQLVDNADYEDYVD